MGSGREQALEPAQRASGPAPLVVGWKATRPRMYIKHERAIKKTICAPFGLYH